MSLIKSKELETMIKMDKTGNENIDIPVGKYRCIECNTILNKSSRSAHLKTIKHQRNAGLLQNEQPEYKNNESKRKTLRDNFKKFSDTARTLVGDELYRELQKYKKRLQRHDSEEARIAYQQALENYRIAKLQSKRVISKQIHQIKQPSVQRNIQQIQREVIQSIVDEDATPTLTKPVIVQKAKEIAGRLSTENKSCDELDQQVKDLLPNRANTINKTYKTWFSQMYKRLFETKWNCKDFAFLKDYGNVIAFLREVSNINTRSNYLQSIVNGYLPLLGAEYQDYIPIYREEYDTVTQEKNRQQKLGKINPDKLQNVVEWNMIRDAINRNYDQLSNMEKRAVLLYTGLPPRRNEDYRSMRITTNKTITGKKRDSNWLIVNMNNYPLGIFFGKYKTKGKYGPQMFDFSKSYRTLSNKLPQFRDENMKEFRQRLQESISDLESGDLLFHTKSNKNRMLSNYVTFVQESFSKILGTKQKIGSTMLRHAWSKHVLDNKPRLNITELEVVAEMAGHSPSKLQSYGQEQVQKREEIDDEEEQEIQQKQLTKTQRKNLKRREKKKQKQNTTVQPEPRVSARKRNAPKIFDL